MAPPRSKPFNFRNKRWSKVFTDFLRQTDNAETKSHYYRTLRRFFLFIEKKYGEQRTPDQIIATDVEEFLRTPVQDHARRAGENLSPYSYNTYLTALKAFYAYCERPIFEFRGKKGLPMIKPGAIPTDQVALARCGDANRDMTEEEVRAFFAVIDRTTLQGRRDFSLFWALFVTGRRRREIVHLRRGDIEPFIFENKRKGWRYHFLAKWRTEKESAEMHQSAIDAIVEFHAAAGRDFYTMAPDEPLFPGILGRALHGQPMALNWATSLFRNYAKKAGIPPGIVTHSLRHEHAWNRFLLNGHNIIDVRNALGHKDVRTTMRYLERRQRKAAGDPFAGLVAAKFAQM